MSTRSGDSKKKGQKYQNSFKFKHNKNSMLTRKIRETPLDFLCERCLDKLEWRIDYRKYKPLSTTAKCNMCQQKNIYKAYRTICEPCASSVKGVKLCTKCAQPVEEYAKPTNWKNDPSKRFKNDSILSDIFTKLKRRYQRTVARKMKEGAELIYDKENGIVDKDTKEVIIGLKAISEITTGESDDDSDYKNENDDDADDNGDDDLGQDDDSDGDEIVDTSTKAVGNKDELSNAVQEISGDVQNVKLTDSI